MKNNVLNKMMLSCKKATELIEKKHQKDLSFSEKFQLKMHTSMCNACRTFQSQSEWIEHSLNGISKYDKTYYKIPSEDIKKVEEKIIDKLEK